MVRLIIFLLLLFVFQPLIKAQSLSPERIAKIKSSTVKVTIPNLNSSGTGFFFNKEGYIITCWHVIEPAVIVDSILKNRRNKNIYVELNSGEKIEYTIAAYFLQAGYQNAVAYDYCILVPLKSQKRIFPFLKLGNFNLTSEGQEIYTCGYPLGIPQQFVSKGIISTKYIDSSNIIIKDYKTKILMPREQALLDLTLNRGNSGGAIVKLGETFNDDEVIGIADFIINPMGSEADQLIKKFDQSYGISLQGVDPNFVFSKFTKILSSMSIGVSGCVSIKYVFDGYDSANKK